MFSLSHSFSCTRWWSFRCQAIWSVRFTLAFTPRSFLYSPFLHLQLPLFVFSIQDRNLTSTVRHAQTPFGCVVCNVRWADRLCLFAFHPKVRVNSLGAVRGHSLACGVCKEGHRQRSCMEAQNNHAIVYLGMHVDARVYVNMCVYKNCKQKKWENVRFACVCVEKCMEAGGGLEGWSTGVCVYLSRPLGRVQRCEVSC